VTYGEGDCKTSYIPPEDVSVRTPLSGYRLVNQKGTAIMRTDLSGRIIQSGSNEGRVAGSSVNIMITNERKNSRLILDLNN
jgi:chorismate synthase